MGKVTYSPGIQYVNGALARPKKVDGHKHGDYLIATHRTAPTTNPDCTRMYIRKADAYDRQTKPTQDELRVRAMFSAVSRAANTRMQNIATLADDMAAFKLQKDQPGGKTTFKSYIWALEKAAYEQNNG